MFEFLKNVLLGKPAEDQPGAEVRPALETAPAPPPPATRSPAPAPREPAPRPPTNGQSNSGSVDVSLQMVLNGFPLELKGRIRQSDVGEATVSIPLDKVMSQLPVGVVRITFGELRRAAPQLFTSGTDCDQVQVPLPLNEILSQINPGLLVRRENQKRIEIPEEIRSPFGERGNGLIFSVGPAKPESPVSTRAITPAAPLKPSSSPLKPAPPAPVQPTKPQAPRATPLPPVPARSSIISAPTPPAPTARPPELPLSSPAPIAFRGVSTGPGVPRETAPPPVPVVPRETAVPRPPALAPEPVAQPARPAAELSSLSLPLVGLTEDWPEALRQEIVQSNLVESKIALPVELMEQALKQGKIAFAWKELRSWIRPAPRPTVSAHDNTVLDLPLKVIAPLFLNRRREAGRPQQKVAIDENIPNLFFGFPQPGSSPAAEAPASHSHAVTKPVDTNYYVWDDTADTARVDESEFKSKAASSPGTSFITRCATPNEVVSRAAALDGVAGALIALPDGLMVASRLAPDLNGDTLAAFLPHIFGKVSQCTKELRMGELNNLNFTVGNVPWKIFRVNAIFFAVFGRPGQPLPTTQLVALAAELDRKKQ
jgi:predicted regulator of Ras-like GTPase activity (Roadblock/LC7/MglB family)